MNNFENRVQLMGADGVPIDVKNNVLHVDTSDHFITFSEEYTAVSGSITARTVITPTSGKDLGVKSVSIGTDSASGLIQLDFVTSTIKVARVYPAKNGQTEALLMHMVGAIDEVLTFAASGLGQTDKVFIVINYVEH